MSLIQEALRRQQQEGQGEETNGETAPPVQPPEEVTAGQPPKLKEKSPETEPEPVAEEEKQPEPSPAPQVKKKHGAPRKTIIITSVVTILILSGLAAFVFVFNKKNQDEAISASVVDKPEKNGKPETKDTASSTKKNKTIEPIKHPKKQSSAPEKDKPTKQIDTTPKVTMPSLSPATKATRKPKEPVIWPILTLNGFLRKGNEGAAIIDGEVISVDEKIKDVNLIKVTRNSVILEYKGETQELKRGDSTH